MAGFADIDAATPLGSANANTIDDQLRALKADIIECAVGVGGLDDGQTTAGHQGLMRFDVATVDPTAANYPAGHIYVRQVSGSTQTSRLRRNVSSTSWTDVGTWLQEIIGTPFSNEGAAFGTIWAVDTVANGNHTKKEVESYTVGANAPTWYFVDACTDSANDPQIIFGPPDNPLETTATSGATTPGIFVWVSRSETDAKVYLNILNDSGFDEDVYTSVVKLKWN